MLCICFSFCLDFHCLRITNKKLKLFANNERITNKIPYSKISENCHFLGTNCHFCVKQLKNDPAFYFYCIFMWQSFEKCDILEENLVFCLNKTKLMGFSPKKHKKYGILTNNCLSPFCLRITNNLFRWRTTNIREQMRSIVPINSFNFIKCSLTFKNINTHWSDRCYIWKQT